MNFSYSYMNFSYLYWSFLTVGIECFSMFKPTTKTVKSLRNWFVASLIMILTIILMTLISPPVENKKEDAELFVYLLFAFNQLIAITAILIQLFELSKKYWVNNSNKTIQNKGQTKDIRIVLTSSTTSVKKKISALFGKVNPQLLMGIVVALFVVFTLIIFQDWLGLKMSAVGDWLFPGSSRTVEVRNLVVGGLQDRQELTTVSMSTKATVHTSQDKKISRLPLGNTHVVYEAIGEVQAGINIQDLKVKNPDSKTGQIEVLLPPPHLTNAFLNINDSQVVVKYRKWLGPSVESELQDEAQKEALRIIKEEACSGKILEKANRNAQMIVEDLLTKANYKNIIITTQPGTCSVN
ncbi:MAG: DUF4230 domain-containing protein [Lyngbya sp.]|nr:DUF4230 domain-containing protein [Lyngbya sp.]